MRQCVVARDKERRVDGEWKRERLGWREMGFLGGGRLRVYETKGVMVRIGEGEWMNKRREGEDV